MLVGLHNVSFPNQLHRGLGIRDIALTKNDDPCRKLLRLSPAIPRQSPIASISSTSAVYKSTASMTMTDSAEWDSPAPDLRVLVKPPHVLLAHNHNLPIIGYGPCALAILRLIKLNLRTNPSVKTLEKYSPLTIHIVAPIVMDITGIEHPVVQQPTYQDTDPEPGEDGLIDPPGTPPPAPANSSPRAHTQLAIRTITAVPTIPALPPAPRMAAPVTQIQQQV